MSVKSPLDDPLDRAKIEIICLGRTLMPDEETFERTVATIALFIIWGGVVLGPMFVPSAEPARYEITVAITAVAFTVLGKMWDFEVKRALEDVVPISTDGGQPRDDDRED